MPEPEAPSEGATRPFEIGPELRPAAEKAVELGLCRECTGRLFGRLGRGLSNPERAERLFGALGIDHPAPPPASCPLCGGAFDRLDHWVTRAGRASEGLEWHRFTCGSRWDPETLAREELLWTTVGSSFGESARAAFNREWGKRIESATGASGGSSGAEIVFLADLIVGTVTTTVQPLFVRGRYRKLDRSLPQTRWPCRRCQGRGCSTCGGSGKTYPESVEELVAAPFLEASGAEGTRFHGMGREDIDARMLGRGRPFVLELLRPRTRTLDIAALAKAAGERSNGRVDFLEASAASGEDVLAVKEANPQKSYRVAVAGEVSLSKINEALPLATGRAIAQRTPTRVAHRRSDLVRSRRILEAHVVAAERGRFTLELRAEAGTYIKEWVEGDGGRTEPSLAAAVGLPLSVDWLDVIEIHDGG